MARRPTIQPRGNDYFVRDHAYDRIDQAVAAWLKNPRAGPIVRLDKNGAEHQEIYVFRGAEVASRATTLAGIRNFAKKAAVARIAILPIEKTLRPSALPLEKDAASTGSTVAGSALLHVTFESFPYGTRTRHDAYAFFPSALLAWWLPHEWTHSLREWIWKWDAARDTELWIGNQRVGTVWEDVRDAFRHVIGRAPNRHLARWENA